jgi:hypothetical protein
MDRKADNPSAPEGEQESEIVDRIARSVLARLTRRRRRLLLGKAAFAAFGLAAFLSLAFVARETWGPKGLPPLEVVETPGKPDKTGAPEEKPGAEPPRDEKEKPAVPIPTERPRSPREVARTFWEESRKFEAPDAGTPSADTRDGLSDHLQWVLPDTSEEAVGLIAADIRRGVLKDRRGLPDRWSLHFARELGRSGVREAWPLLAAVLESLGPQIEAIEAAGDLEDSRAVPILRRWLFLGDKRALAVAEALRKIPGAESIEALLGAADALRGPSGLLLPQFKKTVKTALREREEEVARYLRDAPLARRHLAFAALAEIGSESALATLVQAMEEPALRATARNYLIPIARKDLGPRPEAWSRWLAESSGGEKARKEDV